MSSDEENNVTDLGKFKDRKLYKRILQDIDNILAILDMSQRGLMVFKHYKPVQEIISIIETNKTLFQLKKKAYEKTSGDSKS